jgi:hypothetical protein
MPPDSRNRVVTNNLTNLNKPVLNSKPKEGLENWSFSFKYFNQIDNFGVGGKGASWFVSMLERLKDLSKYSIDSFISNSQLKSTLRYHTINWNQTSIPVKKEDFNWIPKNILNNNEEFPFYQFQISTATGRIIGFWLENIFHIVILDPMHNIQPSKNFNYFVNATKTVESEYNMLLADIDNLKRYKCSNDCNLHMELCKVPTNSEKNFYHFSLDEDYHIELSDKIQNKSITDLIELGLLS